MSMLVEVQSQSPNGIHQCTVFRRHMQHLEVLRAGVRESGDVHITNGTVLWQFSSKISAH